MADAEELTFSIDEVYPIESEASRSRFVTAGNAGISIDYNVPTATFGAGTPQVLVETEYTIKVTPGEDSAMPEDDVVAYVRYRVLVGLMANRPVTQADADSGALDEATMLANFAAHPYHRQGIRALISSMGLPPFPFPATFDPIRESLAEKAQAAVSK